jgi:hypothetical protein
VLFLGDWRWRFLLGRFTALRWRWTLLLLGDWRWRFLLGRFTALRWRWTLLLLGDRRWSSLLGRRGFTLLHRLHRRCGGG